MYALYYNISMLGKPLVFVKALSRVPYLSQCYGSTLFPRRRPSQRHKGLENVHSIHSASPLQFQGKWSWSVRSGTTLLVTQKQIGSERSVVPFHFKLMED